MNEKKTKTRVATKKALANFTEKFNLDESKILALLNKKYLDKLEKRYWTIESIIAFKFKTLSDTETTCNEDIADFIKSLLDKKVNDAILMCKNQDEYKGFTEFLNILPQIKSEILEKGETLFSKYPPINDALFEMLEKRYHETEEFWKRDEITVAMILSPAIREFGKIGKTIHCYTQKDGDIMITTNKYDWDGKKYTKATKQPKVEVKDISIEIVDNKNNSGSGCMIVMLCFIIAGISLFLL